MDECTVISGIYMDFGDFNEVRGCNQSIIYKILKVLALDKKAAQEMVERRTKVYVVNAQLPARKLILRQQRAGIFPRTPQVLRAHMLLRSSKGLDTSLGRRN